MNTKIASKRARRHLITFLGLAALLLPVFLFVPPPALPQDRPVPPPPGRGLPRGPLTPVRTISIDSSYLLCNSLQLQSARRVVWEPVLSSLGTTLSERDTYGLALDNAATEVCAGRLNSPLLNKALGDLDKVMTGVEGRMFGRSLLTSDERIKLSRALLEAAYDEFQSRCFDNRAKEAELMIGRLPKTPDIGLGLEAQPTSAALGRCNSSSGGTAPSPGIDIAFAQNQFQACADKILSNASQDCTDPVGQDRGTTPSTRLPFIVGDTGWQRAPDGSKVRAFQVNDPDGKTRAVYQVENPDGSRLTHTEYYARGTSRTRGDIPYRETYEVEAGGRHTRFEINYRDPTLDVRPPRNPEVRRRWEAEWDQILSVTPEERLEFNRAVQTALGVSPSSDPTPAGRLPPGPAGPTNQCQAMTNSSTGRLGLLRQSTDSVEGSGSRELISGTDLVLRCLCAFGSRGAQLANQIARATGSPGVSCSNNEWLRRVDCVVDPRGPVDGIRPECLEYLRADYQFETPQTACDAAIQCPEGSQPIVVGRPGSSACRCSKDSTASGPRLNCALVRCPRPGTPSSDPAVQACCGAPGDKPDKPSDGPPIPPRPGEAPGSKPGEKPEPFDPKKTDEFVGNPVSVTLPKLLGPSELIGAARATSGKIQIVSMASAKSPEAKSLDWTGMSSGDQLTLRFDFTDQLSGALYVSFMLGPQAGTLRVHVNGKEIGEQIELGGTSQTVTKALVGKIDFRRGTNTVTFVFRSRDNNSPTRVSLLELSVDK